jgi:uncharacterized membrane protein YhiD involved in acid resistance
MPWIDSAETALVLRAIGNMILGGLLALYARALYRRFGSSISNRDLFSSVFPMLTVVTVVIIFVVKASLALSLGLVGALSIVRFRAAIKSPEELVYLFLCIGIGVALGAEQRLLAIATMVVASAFLVGRQWLSRRKGSASQNLLLTVTGDAARFFQGEERTLLEILKRRSGASTVQRFDLEDGQIQLRASVSVAGLEETTGLMSELSERLPGFRVSYLNLETLA